MVNDSMEGHTLTHSGELDDFTEAELPDIPFNRTGVEGLELEYVQEAIQGGRPSSGGPFSQRAATLLEDYSGAEEVLLTTSCTAALELTAMLLELGPEDTVIVPSFTFTTTAAAFAREGARLVFCDVERSTMGLDPDHLATLLDDHVRAVVVVHYAGIPCDMERINAVLAQRPDIALVEDNAHGLFGSWQGHPLGSLGRFATQSFHETKNIVCGEGGALLLNDPRDVDRAHVLYEKGTNRRAFMLGQADKYTWKDAGSSFGLSDVLAAYLLAQLEQRDSIQHKRRAVWESYQHRLGPLAEELGFQLMEIPSGVESAYHMFYVLLPDVGHRNDVLETMRKSGVQATFHYLPLHSSDAGRKFAARPTECPVTDEVSGRILRLPFHNGLDEAEIDRVVDTFLTSVLATAPV
jgi:dTDP-4-amino-4,6-dideoxygalactose transaminase